MYIIKVLQKWKHVFRDTVWAQSLPVSLGWWREPVHSSELLKCLLKHLQTGGLKEGWSCCSAGVYEPLEVSQSRILVLWANSDLCWSEKLPGFSLLLPSAILGWRSCWGAAGRGSGLGAILLPLEFFTLEVQQDCAIASRAGSCGSKAGLFLASDCLDHDFPRDASSSPSHSSCFGMNWWSSAVPCIFPQASESFRCLVWARCLSRA